MTIDKLISALQEEKARGNGECETCMWTEDRLYILGPVMCVRNGYMMIDGTPQPISFNPMRGGN